MYKITQILLLTATVFSFSYLYTQTLLMVEGISGSGKSTLSKIISAHMPNVCIIPEPFDRWNNVHEQGNLFKLFLEDQTRWGLTFQNYVFFTHYQALADAYAHNEHTKLFITDRSYFSGIFIFMRLLFKNHKITPLEYALYQELTFWFIEHLPYKPDGFIYLQTLPTIACARAHKRNRTLHTSLELSFYEDQHRLHEDWLIRKNTMPPFLQDVPILVLNGNREFETDTDTQMDLITQIVAFVSHITETKTLNK